jgi:chromosome segregation ATPase
MLGQIPAKVTVENEEIKVGDSLTSSSQPGYLRKAKAGEPTVGIALENAETGNNTIQVMISRKNKSLTVDNIEQEVQTRIANLEIEDQVNQIIANGEWMLETNAKIKELENGYSNNIQTLTTLTTTLDNLETTVVNNKEDLTTLAENITSLTELTTTITETITDHEERITRLETLIQNEQGNLEIPELSNINSVLETFADNLTLIQAEDTDAEGNIIPKQIFTLSGDLVVERLKAKKIEAEEIEVAGIRIKEGERGKNSGTSIIKAGDKEVVVAVSTIEKNSQIIVTPTGNLQQATYYVEKHPKQKQFKIIISYPLDEDIGFDWLIIQN